MTQVRQGDLLLTRIDGKEDVQELDMNGACIIGHGEVTGHKHVVTKAQWLIDAAEEINQDVFDRLYNFAEGDNENAVQYIKVDEGAVLTHEEHSAIDLDPGVYEVTRQRTYVSQGRDMAVWD